MRRGFAISLLPPEPIANGRSRRQILNCRRRLTQHLHLHRPSSASRLPLFCRLLLFLRPPQSRSHDACSPQRPRPARVEPSAAERCAETRQLSALPRPALRLHGLAVVWRHSGPVSWHCNYTLDTMADAIVLSKTDLCLSPHDVRRLLRNTSRAGARH